jgi:hypothetical protein
LTAEASAKGYALGVGSNRSPSTGLDLGATITGALSEEGLDHYAVGMKDPEGNEFDIN